MGGGEQIERDVEEEQRIRKLENIQISQGQRNDIRRPTRSHSRTKQSAKIVGVDIDVEVLNKDECDDDCSDNMRE